MKRIVLIWMAAFLMGGMAMAQHAHHSDKMPEPKVRAERMTEWEICRCIVPKHTSIIREMASAIN